MAALATIGGEAQDPDLRFSELLLVAIALAIMVHKIAGRFRKLGIVIACLPPAVAVIDSASSLSQEDAKSLHITHA